MEIRLLIILFFGALVPFTTCSDEDFDAIMNLNERYSKLLNPPKPDFRREGVRISEAKCEEYMWDLKREEMNEELALEINEEHPNSLVGILGGKNADPGEFPHMSAIGWKTKKGGWEFYCGGFLISERFVVTAAHCNSIESGNTLVEANQPPEIVRFGVENIIKDERPPLDIAIQKFISHPRYDGRKKRRDIALIRLATDVIFDKFVRPACILNKPADQAIVTGWGITEKKLTSHKTSSVLKKAVVNIVDRDNCQKKLLSKLFFVRPHHICACEPAGKSDACRGDSGGPLQTKMDTGTKAPMYNVIGVTSLGFVCGSKRFPGIYTNVSSFIDWIEATVWRDEKLPITTAKPMKIFHVNRIDITF